MPLPEPLPRALQRAPRPEVDASPALSLMARPGDGGIATRRIAVLVDDGVRRRLDRGALPRCSAQGAVPRFVGPQLGQRSSRREATAVEAEISLEAGPAVVYDAVVLPGGDRPRQARRQRRTRWSSSRTCIATARRFSRLGEAQAILDKAGIPPTLPDGGADAGLVRADAGDAGALDAFVAAIAAAPRLRARNRSAASSRGALMPTPNRMQVT